MRRKTLLDEYKIQASILFKQLHSSNLTLKNRAISRFKLLGHLKDLSIDRLPDYSGFIKRKHSLLVIALENNFESWKALKDSVAKKRNIYTPLYPKRCAGFTNDWYPDYESAKSALKKQGGFLFPYNAQYFLAQKTYVETLGLKPDDFNWEKIGYDWVKPNDLNAWNALSAQLKELDEH